MARRGGGAAFSGYIDCSCSPLTTCLLPLLRRILNHCHTIVILVIFLSLPSSSPSLLLLLSSSSQQQAVNVRRSDKWVLVVDFHGFGLKDAHPKTSVLTLHLLNHYPERLGVCVMVRVRCENRQP